MKYVVVRGPITTNQEEIRKNRIIGYDCAIGEKLAEVSARKRLRYHQEKEEAFLVLEAEGGYHTTVD